MNFKEKFKRYEEGKATPEEKREVLEEIEKYETIEEYYTNSISDDFFSDESEPQATKEETNGIKKVVNKRLRKIILLSVLAAAALYIGIFYGVSSIVDTFYYDPTEVTYDGDGEWEKTDFHYDLKAYVSLNMPGYASHTTSEAKSTGFGNFEINYSLQDLFRNKEEVHFMNISRDEMTFGINGIFSFDHRFKRLNGFDDIYFPSPDEATEEAMELRATIREDMNETTIEYLEGLNDLSYVSMNITFEEDLSMADFHNLEMEYENIEFKWAGVRTAESGKRWGDNQPMHLIGFNPNFDDEPNSLHNMDQDEFPMFHLTDMMEIPSMPVDEFPEVYVTHFTSRLKYLSEREEFVRLFDSSPDKIEFYQQSLAYIEENGVETYGGLVFGTPEDLLELIDGVSYESLYLNDVLPVKPYIY